MPDIFGNSTNGGGSKGGKGMIIFMVVIACCCCYCCSCGIAYLQGWLDFIFKPEEQSSSSSSAESGSPSPNSSPVGGEVGTCTEKLNGKGWETNSDKSVKAFIPWKQETCSGWCGWSARSNSWAKVKVLANDSVPRWHTATWNECKDNPNQKSYELPEALLNKTLRIVNVNKKTDLSCSGSSAQLVTTPGMGVSIKKEGRMNQYGRYTIKFENIGGPCHQRYLTASNTDTSISFLPTFVDNDYQQWYFSPIDEAKGIVNIISVGRIKDNRFLSAVPNNSSVVSWNAADSDRQQWQIIAA